MMIKKILINLFEKLGFAVKFYNLRKYNKFKVSSDKQNLDLFNTPTGKYYLPSYLKKDTVAQTIKSGEIFEKEIIEVAKKYIKENQSILDIGANYGQMTVVLSKHVAKLGNGVVYSFEAEPFVGEILSHNIQLNECNNVKKVLKAVYHKNAEKLFFPNPDFKKFSAFGSYGIDPAAKNGRTVETITIDSLNIQEPICFIKVDIQGCDLFALQGAVETIKRYKPVIIFEFEEQFQEEFNTTFNDYVEFVRSIDYKFVSTHMNINFLIMPN